MTETISFTFFLENIVPEQQDEKLIISPEIIKSPLSFFEDFFDKNDRKTFIDVDIAKNEMNVKISGMPDLCPHHLFFCFI